MKSGVEERRVAIEAIATLVNIRRAMAELILRPAGIPPEIYVPLLRQRDESAGRPLAKREMAPLILDAVERRPDGEDIIRNIIEIAADWDSYHLAHDEFAARRPERLLRAINTPTRDTITAFCFAWSDTSQERAPDTEAYAVLNDQERSVSVDLLHALEAYQIQPMLWGARERYLEVLAA